MAESKSSTAKKSSKSTEGSVTAVVFVPCGPTPRNDILTTAITAVRNQIPVVYTLNPEITDVSDVKTNEGVKGRDYTVTVNYNTDVEGAEPVNVDQEIEKLTVPRLPDYEAAVLAGGGSSDAADNPK